jgi:hypothetical protein
MLVFEGDPGRADRTRALPRARGYRLGPSRLAGRQRLAAAGLDDVLLAELRAAGLVESWTPDPAELIDGYIVQVEREELRGGKRVTVVEDVLTPFIPFAEELVAEGPELITLTPHAVALLRDDPAHRPGVELQERGHHARPVWREAGSYQPRPRVRKGPGERRLKNPELLAQRKQSEYLCDDDDQPIELFKGLGRRGVQIRIDRRLGRRPGPKRGGGGRAA